MPWSGGRPSPAQLAEAESFPQALAGAAGGPAAGPEPPALHLARLKQELTAARTRYTDAHPTVTRLKEEIAAVERDLPAPSSEAKPPRRPRRSLHRARTCSACGSPSTPPSPSSRS